MNLELFADMGLKLVVVLATGYAAFAFAKAIMVMVQPNPVAEYLGTGKKQRRPGQASVGDRMGAVIAQRLPFSLAVWKTNLIWAQRGGEYEGRTIEQIIFQSALFGGLGVIYPLLVSAPAAWLVPAILTALPFMRLRSAAQNMRIRAEQSVPEMASLIAAETAAGVSPEEALMQASKLPGPLAGLVREAIARSAYLGIPAFGHADRKGALRTAFEESGIPALRAFGVQLDVAASRGVEVSQRMSEISSSLAAEYRQRLLRKTEKLDTSMTVAVAMFYFAPMMGLILMPLLYEAMNAI